MTSKELAKALHRERRERFEREFVPLRSTLVSYANRRTCNWHDAEDAAHNALLSIMKAADEGRVWQNPAACATRYCKNAVWVLWSEHTTHAGGLARERFVPLREAFL